MIKKLEFSFYRTLNKSSVFRWPGKSFVSRLSHNIFYWEEPRAQIVVALLCNAEKKMLLASSKTITITHDCLWNWCLSQTSLLFGAELTPKIELLLRRVKCRIAESLFVPSNQISYFSFCFVESSFVQWICISIKMNFVLADWNFPLLSFSSLLFLFLQRFSMFFVAIYQFTKWNKCS